MDPDTHRAEAERWLAIAAKLLTTRDFLGSRTFAMRARESDPTNPISDQLLAIIDTLLSSEKRVDPAHNPQPDYYSVLQLPRLARDPDLISSHFRRLSFLLHPGQNRFPFSDFALQLVMDAWSVLSDPNKKWVYDNQLLSGPGPGPGLNTHQLFQPAQMTWQQQQGQEELPPQWQMRDPTPTKGRGVGVATSAAVPTWSDVPPPTLDGNHNVDNNNNNATINNNIDVNENHDDGARNNNDGDDDGVVGEEKEGFWTSCPYCLCVFEYDKMYLECTLRCQNCRRGFHGLQIPNPPFHGGGVAGGKKMDISFSSWSFFPLGFSKAMWKKHCQSGPNGTPNWVPFSPMFPTPGGNGVGSFQWFVGDGNAAVGPRIVEGKSGVRSPRVYIDDDEDFVEESEPSDADSSDCDWRNTYKKRTKHRRARTGGRGGARRVDEGVQGRRNTVVGGGVSVGGENMEDGSETQAVVVGLAAGGLNKNMASAVMRKRTRRSVKDMGNLDLNVEFNNEGDDHAPSMGAVNGDEDAIANIGFFEGLDEFFSNLPILNVGGDDKAKPS